MLVLLVLSAPWVAPGCSTAAQPVVEPREPDPITAAAYRTPSDRPPPELTTDQLKRALCRPQDDAPTVRVINPGKVLPERSGCAEVAKWPKIAERVLLEEDGA